MKHLILFLLITLSSSIYSQETSYICAGTTKTLTASVTGGTAPLTYNWTSPSNVTTSGATVTANAAGVWVWTCIDAVGCTASGTHTINYVADPTSGITINANNTCVGTAQTISATGVPAGYTYSWDFGSGANPQFSNTSSESVSYSTSGSKTIELTIDRLYSGTSNGCSPTCVWIKTTTINITTLTGSSSCN